jgi:hypothetical protein
MKRVVVALVATGLLAFTATAPAVARRKKPKPTAPVSVEQKLFLRQDSESCQTPHTFLSTTDGPDVACFYHDAGAPYEVANQVQPIPTAVWAVEDAGVPFVFDTAKRITGEITLRGGDAGAGSVSAGQARFDLTVLATVGGEVREVGAVSETWTTTPGDVHVVKLDLAIDPAFAGRRVDAFRIDTTLRGAAIGPHTIELDDPAAVVVVPTLR